MQRVGHHLQLEAIKKTGTERDVYARSAYNRYYYAVFLTVRSLLGKLDPKWSRGPHKSYPEVLKGSITKNFKTAKWRANKNGDYALIPKLDGGIRASAALANLVEKANAVRVIADYEPSEFVNFETAERFSLKSVEITEAHNWESSVKILTDSIFEAWRQINV